MTNNEKVVDYLKKTKLFYLTTVDEDQPKCRPFGYVREFDGKIYFVTGTFKEVYKQLQKNPKVEICASNSGGFLRYYGTAVFVDNDSLVEQALNDMPYLRKIYNDETGNKLEPFYLKDATAEFRDILDVKESFKL